MARVFDIPAWLLLKIWPRTPLRPVAMPNAEQTVKATVIAVPVPVTDPSTIYPSLEA